MIQRIINYCRLLKKMNIWQFYKLNYFSKNIYRIDNSKIIPYKNSVIDIFPNAKIYLGKGDIEIGCDLLKGSKTETRVRLRENAIWSSDGGCKISYGSTLEILDGAVFDNGYFTMNCNSILIAGKRISFGHDVMISRNVVMYDSDFHSLITENNEVKNPPQEVIIGNHVWIGANCLVLKGTKIGSGSVIAADTKVSGKVGNKMLYHSQNGNVFREISGTWERKSP